jgi:hypothetical protein
MSNNQENKEENEFTNVFDQNDNANIMDVESKLKQMEESHS